MAKKQPPNNSQTEIVKQIAFIDKKLAIKQLQLTQLSAFVEEFDKMNVGNVQNFNLWPTRSGPVQLHKNVTGRVRKSPPIPKWR